jgi:polar amino acid transport system substrate-binding protein
LKPFAVVAAALTALATVAAWAGDLPPVPAEFAKAGVIRAGIKCDYPPDGYLDAQGKHKGIEVGVARQIAIYAFGDASKIEYTCVTAANRIPTLVGGKIDFLIATVGINDARKKVVDFSDPYAWGGSDVVVPEGSPVKTLKDLKGKTVVVLKGAWQIGWFEKNMPDVTLLKLDNVSDGLQALMQNRAAGYAHDYAVLVGIAKKNPKIHLVGELYQIGFRGAAIRKGDEAVRTYVSAAIKKAYADGVVAQLIKENVEPDLQAATLKNWDLSQVPKH